MFHQNQTIAQSYYWAVMGHTGGALCGREALYHSFYIME